MRARNALREPFLLHPLENTEVERFERASLALFRLLVASEAAVPAGETITMIRHEVAGSTSLAEGKRSIERVFINFVVRDNG